MHGTKKATEDMFNAYIAMNAKSPAESLKKSGKPALENGGKQLTNKVKWGKKSADGSVDPKKIQGSFADSL